MAISTKSTEDKHSPEQLSVEMSPELYRAIVDFMKVHELSMSVEQLLEILEDRLGDTVISTVAEITGEATPFPRGVDVDLQIAEADEDIDDDDSYVRESIKQGIRDVLNEDVLTEEQFWKAVADDE
jgi:hypothetical protein